MLSEHTDIGRIRLDIMLPTEIFLEKEVLQVRAESHAGEFCLKPRHIDYVTSLVPGILSYTDSNRSIHFVAIDGGILVKENGKVSIATRNAVEGELGTLVEIVQQMQEEFLEREKVSRSASAKLEIGFLKQFIQLSGN